VWRGSRMRTSEIWAAFCIFGQECFGSPIRLVVHVAGERETGRPTA
jgi:hypothetical protein